MSDEQPVRTRASDRPAEGKRRPRDATETRQPRREGGEDDGRHPARSARDGHHRLSAVEAARAGLRELAELTGKRPEGVIGVERGDDGQWLVKVEVVEDARIPSSTDLLASYQIDLSADGGIEAYRRLRRYARGHGSDNPGEG